MTLAHKRFQGTDAVSRTDEIRSKRGVYDTLQPDNGWLALTTWFSWTLAGPPGPRQAYAKKIKFGRDIWLARRDK